MKLKHFFASSLVAAALAGAGSTANAVVLLGNPYTPTGADYQITALQGIDASHPMGQSGFNPQVNHDFEFDGSTGVSYDTGGGTLKDFGLGLYNGANNAVQSTGLRIDYNSLVTASSVVVTIEDFDIKAGHDTFFNSGKVEPTLLLLGANNSIFAQANPTDIFSALSPVSGGGKADVWDLNFQQLLSNLNIADGAISGFILGADMAHGEKPNSDPYLLVSVGSGIPVIPEASTYAGGLFGIGIALASLIRSLKRRTA